MKTLVVVNPAARSGEVGRHWPSLEREVLGRLAGATGGSGPVQVMQTESADHGRAQVRAAVESGARRLVIVGGDGTVSDVVGFCMDGDRPIAPDLCIAVLPGGRGDDFFRSILDSKPAQWLATAPSGLWERGLALLAEGAARPLDLGWIEFDGEASVSRTWVNVLSFGFPGLVVQKVRENERFFGVPVGEGVFARMGLTYLAQSLSALLDYRALEMSVRADGKTVFEGKAFGAFVLNGAYNAGGVRWSNQARLDDGVLEVLVVEPRGLVGLARLLPQMATGQWGDTPGVHRVRAREVELSLGERERKRHALFDVDGDQPEPEECRSARIRVLPQVIGVWR